MAHAPTQQTQAAADPASILQGLVEGNTRFTAGQPRDRDVPAAIRQTSTDQFPLAAVLGCIDSRVPVEQVLDAGIGEIFVARTAGNVVDDDTIGGLEFATKLAGAKVIVVLGHTACGAVQGACAGAELGLLTGLLAKITPAVRAVTGEGSPGGVDAAVVNKVVESNVRNSMRTLADRSDVLRQLVQAGDIMIVGGVYDVATGEISWMSE